MERRERARRRAVAEGVEYLRWKYGVGPVPARVRRQQARQATLGCLVRLAVAFAFCAALILLVWLLWR